MSSNLLTRRSLINLGWNDASAHKKLGADGDYKCADGD